MNRHSVSVDPSRLYWAVLTLPRRAGREGALAAFEEYLPLPVEDLHAVFVRAPGGQTVACGMAREAAASLVQAGARVATPAAVPEWVGLPVSARSFSLLVGEFAPRVVRRWRRASAAVSIAAAVVVVAATTVGAERRRAAADVLVEEARRETAALLERAGVAAEGGGPPALRLAAAVREARAWREQSEQALRVSDAAPTLAAVLRVWPRDARARTDLVRVEAAGVTISTRVRDADEASRLADALRRSSDLMLDPPQVTGERDGVHVQFRLRHVGGTP